MNTVILVELIEYGEISSVTARFGVRYCVTGFGLWKRQ